MCVFTASTADVPEIEITRSCIIRELVMGLLSISSEPGKRFRYGRRRRVCQDFDKATKLTYHPIIQRDEPPQKISKLAILAETEEDRYDTVTSVMCYDCQTESSSDYGPKLSAVVEGVMKALSFSKREEIKAWEQEFVPCEHTVCLVQQDKANVHGDGKEPHQGITNDKN